jgi:hypothetical protein
LSSNIGGSYIFINFEDLCKSSAEKFLIQDWKTLLTLVYLKN